jgi:hypothetical protein
VLATHSYCDVCSKSTKEMTMSNYVVIVIFYTCKAREEDDDDVIVIFFATMKEKRKRRKEEEGAYFQAPTSAPLAFALLLPPC